MYQRFLRLTHYFKSYEQFKKNAKFWSFQFVPLSLNAPIVIYNLNDIKIIVQDHNLTAVPQKYPRPIDPAIDLVYITLTLRIQSLTAPQGIFNGLLGLSVWKTRSRVNGVLLTVFLFLSFFLAYTTACATSFIKPSGGAMTGRPHCYPASIRLLDLTGQI